MQPTVYIMASEKRGTLYNSKRKADKEMASSMEAKPDC